MSLACSASRIPRYEGESTNTAPTAFDASIVMKQSSGLVPEHAPVQWSNTAPVGVISGSTKGIARTPTETPSANTGLQPGEVGPPLQIGAPEKMTDAPWSPVRTVTRNTCTSLTPGAPCGPAGPRTFQVIGVFC